MVVVMVVVVVGVFLISIFSTSVSNVNRHRALLDLELISLN